MSTFFSKLSQVDDAILKLQNQSTLLGRLSVASTTLEDALVERFMAAVANNTTIVDLTIEETHLTPAGMQHVANALKANRTLTCLLFCS
jgi:hypothetical protein